MSQTGVSVSGTSCPPRSTTISVGRPPWALKTSPIWDWLGFWTSPIWTIMSPGCRPAIAAGDGCWLIGGVMPTTLAAWPSPTHAIRIENRMPATRKCDSGPHRITMTRCQTGFAV